MGAYRAFAGGEEQRILRHWDKKRSEELAVKRR